MIRFEAADEGLAVTDVIENTRYRIETGPVTLGEAGGDELPAPVDDATRVRVTHVTLPTVVDCYLRRPDGELVDAVSSTTIETERPAVLETTTAPMKLYLRFDEPATVHSGQHQTTIQFDGPTELVVGARSSHRHPAGTITLPRDPASLARAVSLFGSALKTTSPERSFPTLRGHPPLIEFGSEFDDAGLEAPETGIRIEVPCDYESVFTVTPLAYYLGAEVSTYVDDSEPRLVAAGETHPLAGDLRRATAEVLRHLFLLDCVTRTEGLYRVNLHEREEVAKRVDIDPELWYDLPINERVAEYLKVPMRPIADLMDWHLTADVEPVEQNAEILPFLANDLALVRSPTGAVDREGAVREPGELEDFFRAPSEGLVRSTRATQNAVSIGDDVVSPIDVDTYGHIWVGQHFPMGASKPTIESYKRRLDRQPSSSGAIDVTLVCNDPEMLGETEEGLYGFFDMLTFNVESHYDLTTAEFRAVLEEETDFLHYVGHVEDEGVQCSDGYLDIEEMDDVGVDAFLLNGCQSYEQGKALVDAGALGGVVTLTTVSNRIATQIGRNIAHLLDIGFDFFGALDVVRRTDIARKNYVVVGNGKLTISQSDSGAPYFIEQVDEGDDQLTINYYAYPTARFDIGSLGRPVVEKEKQYVAVGYLNRFEIEKEFFESELGDERVPIIVDGTLKWTN